MGGGGGGPSQPYGRETTHATMPCTSGNASHRRTVPSQHLGGNLSSGDRVHDPADATAALQRREQLRTTGRCECLGVWRGKGDTSERQARRGRAMSTAHRATLH